MSKERLRVTDRRDIIYLEDLIDNKTLEEAQMAFGRLFAEYEPEIMKYGHEAKIMFDHYGYDGGYEAYVVVTRDENDTEYNTRMTALERTKEKKRIAAEKKKEKARKILADTEAEERAEYERLRAKYGT